MRRTPEEPTTELGLGASAKLRKAPGRRLLGGPILLAHLRDLLERVGARILGRRPEACERTFGVFARRAGKGRAPAQAPVVQHRPRLAANSHERRSFAH